MDSFVPALIAAFLAAATDKPCWLAAILGDRWPKRNAVVAGAIVANAALMAIAAIGAIAIAATLNPSARNLLAGIALVVAAIGAAMPARPPADRLDGWHLGALGTTTLGLFILGFGEGAQFVAFGFAVRGSDAWLAAGGAALGSSVPAAAAALMGEAQWRRLPLRAAGFACAGLLFVAGCTMSLGGLRLI
jgi:Ca2+/H+ antiporter, TMEM165/GDT1 family